jgi:hypothetical protein
MRATLTSVTTSSQDMGSFAENTDLETPQSQEQVLSQDIYSLAFFGYVEDEKY